ncbi:MAG TPA: DUF732 domain-containing protein [Acidimicrobiales bacterium]|nr:DUF732 domain-containing protein [Acidimicrobiales bacterium]
MAWLRFVTAGFAGGALAVAALGGCRSGTGAPSTTDRAYLAEVHGSAPNINALRSDTQLIRLGHAVCDDFRAHASYQAVADRLSTESGADHLDPSDLGVVITAAADNYCPQYRSLVS